jgi:hypothetical protein
MLVCIMLPSIVNSMKLHIKVAGLPCWSKFCVLSVKLIFTAIFLNFKQLQDSKTMFCIYSIGYSIGVLQIFVTFT